MFSKFHHQTPPSKASSPPRKFKSPLHPTPKYLHHQFHHLTKDSQASEESDSATPVLTTAANSTNPSVPSPKRAKITNPSTNNEDGATIEVVRRPRGRPPGSKNRPKPPIVITREPDVPSIAPYILEIPGGVDMVDSLTRFTRRRNVGICVLTASGTVANVNLKQPTTNSASSNNGSGTVTFHGRFQILSLSAVLLGSGTGGGNNNNNNNNGSNSGYSQNGVFTISLSGPQGQVVGGKLVGALLAAGTVYVVATSFNSPYYHRLPVDYDNDDVHCGSSPGASGGRNGGGNTVAAGGECLGMYNLGSDVLWAPTAARPPTAF